MGETEAVVCREKMAGLEGCMVPCMDCIHACHLSPQESLVSIRKHYLWCEKTEKEADEAVEREREFFKKIGLKVD